MLAVSTRPIEFHGMWRRMPVHSLGELEIDGRCGRARGGGSHGSGMPRERTRQPAPDNQARGMSTPDQVEQLVVHVFSYYASTRHGPRTKHRDKTRLRPHKPRPGTTRSKNTHTQILKKKN